MEKSPHIVGMVAWVRTLATMYSDWPTFLTAGTAAAVAAKRATALEKCIMSD